MSQLLALLGTIHGVDCEGKLSILPDLFVEGFIAQLRPIFAWYHPSLAGLGRTRRRFAPHHAAGIGGSDRAVRTNLAVHRYEDVAGLADLDTSESREVG